MHCPVKRRALYHMLSAEMARPHCISFHNTPRCALLYSSLKMHTSGHLITVSTERTLMAFYHSFFYELHATGHARKIIHLKNPTKVDLFNIHLVFLVKIYTHFLQESN